MHHCCILLPHLTQLCTVPEALNLHPSSRNLDVDPADDQRVLGWRAKRVGARFQPKNWEEQLHNKWELALRPPCHQSKKCWRLFSQLASLSCRFGMIEPDHGTGCEHQPIELKTCVANAKAGSLDDSGDQRKGVSNHPATFTFNT